MNKKNKILMIALLVFSFMLVVIGAAYASGIYKYSEKGKKESKIQTSSTVKFHYDEGTMNGINLTDALPTADEHGKKEKYFEFYITSTTLDDPLPYILTARKEAVASEISEGTIRIYLTTVKNGQEEEVLLDSYSNLESITKNNHVEQVLYTDTVPANQNNFKKTFRLRMWIEDNTPYPDILEKSFSIRVNTYANN